MSLSEEQPRPAPALEAFISGLPKAELHVHHVGSASPAIVAELAARHPGRVPSDPEELADYFTFTDFAHFVDLYLSVVDLVRTPEDIWTLTHGIAEELARQQVRYVELTCSPVTNVRAGVPIEAFVDAIEDVRLVAERDLGLTMRWIWDIPGELGLPAGEETLRYALEHGPSTLIGFGLGGPEIGVPRPQFGDVFAQARAAGLHSVPHAGETTGPETIWDALRVLGAERIGHGTSAVQDPALLAHLAEHRIPVEVSPTSNIATRAVATYGEHPLRQLVEAGVPVSINSDDPPMFSTTLTHEYGVAAVLLDLDEAGLADLAVAAVDHSFAPSEVKAAIREEIRAYASSQPTS
ncbi:MAG TPA: adenosine deaminase [Propionibacteriaceae bacterium]|nr:adenosine deaminase [Propionibacteriaceae bacterium]